MRKTREERKIERSQAASRAVNARWEQYHASCVCPVYDDPRPEDMYEITAKNLMTGNTHVLVLHPGPRSDNFRIDMDGKPWKVGGFTLIERELRRGLSKSKPGRIF